MIAVQVFGQSRISGTLSDQQGNPLAYANVAALQVKDSLFVTGTISDSIGCFKLQIPQRDVLLRVTLLGYEDCYIQTLNGEALHIVMQEAATALDEVTVTARLPQYRMTGEGLLTNVQGTMLSKMGTAEDVLKHVPSVIKKSGGWEVFGKGQPLIYLNGRPLQDLSELDNIKSEDVKSVELIQSPGAKYSASVGAVIRIKTIPPRGEGLSLDVRSTYRYNKYQYHDYVEQLNLNYRRNAFNAFVTYKYANTRSVQDATFEQTTYVDTLWQQISNNYDKGKTEYHYLQGGFYTSLKDKHFVGAKYSVVFTGDEHVDGWMDDKVLADGNFYDYIVSTSYDQIKDKPIHRLNAYYNGSIGETSVDFNTNIYYKKGIKHSDILEESQEFDSRNLLSTSTSANRMIASKLIFESPVWKGGNSATEQNTPTSAGRMPTT